ncbi:hypothetical protein CMO86_09585, partial [Candidatus Woesearchaeota archaeon]|nr:hypothetical protein [Candidatus Woesearchaeota archaeon]
MAFKSSKGREVGKELKVFKSTSIGQGVGGGGAAAPTAIQATGGAIQEPGNGFKYHVFISDAAQTFDIESGTGDLDILVVAAGGGGGGAGNDGIAAGGGGGGGVLMRNQPNVSGPITYPVSVGSAAARQTGNQRGGQGGGSSFGTPGQTGYTATDGGGGGGGTTGPQAPGGSGGSGGG